MQRRRIIVRSRWPQALEVLLSHCLFYNLIISTEYLLRIANYMLVTTSDVPALIFKKVRISVRAQSLRARICSFCSFVWMICAGLLNEYNFGPNTIVLGSLKRSAARVASEGGGPLRARLPFSSRLSAHLLSGGCIYDVKRSDLDAWID